MRSVRLRVAEGRRPMVVSAEMGYGHLRAAVPVAAALDTPVVLADREPLASPGDRRVWDGVRRLHELSSRGSELPLVGPPMRRLLDAATSIPPLHPLRNLADPTAATLALERLVDRGFGDGLVRALRADDRPLLTTFYAPAVVADLAGLREIYCIVTDADVNRVWVPRRPRSSAIRYLVPTRRVMQRLRAYGVPEANVTFTGFPLPLSLLGDEHLDVLRADLAQRLVRLDPHGSFRDQCRHELSHFFPGLPATRRGPAPRLTFAVGGAGAQARIIDAALPGLRAAIEGGRLCLTLVAGTRREVQQRFVRSLQRHRLGHQLGRAVEIVYEPDHHAYFEAFEQLLRRTDVLWTKPSELTFYAALGLPLVLTDPVGAHERFNRRWIREQGVGLEQRDPRFLAGRLREWLHDGTLAAAAWSGFVRLPKLGTRRILEEIGTARPSCPRARP
ncbi:MAG: hypothetical protein H6712_29270 [Myxococcales bacterium]|nr:hypothetical protein [Myxococcales bacterium]